MAKKNRLHALDRQGLAHDLPRREVDVLETPVPRHLEVVLARVVVLEAVDVPGNRLELSFHGPGLQVRPLRHTGRFELPVVRDAVDQRLGPGVDLLVRPVRPGRHGRLGQALGGLAASKGLERVGVGLGRARGLAEQRRAARHRLGFVRRRRGLLRCERTTASASRRDWFLLGSDRSHVVVRGSLLVDDTTQRFHEVTRTIKPARYLSKVTLKRLRLLCVPCNFPRSTQHKYSTRAAKERVSKSVL